MRGSYRRGDTVALDVQPAAMDMLLRMIRDLPAGFEYLRDRAA